MRLARIVKNRACLTLSIGLLICSVLWGSQLINSTHLWMGLWLYGSTVGSFILWVYLVQEHQAYVLHLSKRLQGVGIPAYKYELLRLPILKPRQLDRVFSLIQDGDDFEMIKRLFAVEAKA